MFLQHSLGTEFILANITRDRPRISVSRFDVRIESILSTKLAVAMGARVRVFTSVMEHMRTQLSRLDETLRAICAFMRSFTCMDFQMPIECLLGGKSPLALSRGIREDFYFVWTEDNRNNRVHSTYHCACIWLFAGVRSSMLTQCPIRWKWFVAKIAWKWTFASVSANMNAGMKSINWYLRMPCN